MPHPDDEFSSPVTDDLAEGLMMPTAELGAPLIAAVLLVIGLATYLGPGRSMHRFNSATNAAHLRASVRPQDGDSRHAGRIGGTIPNG